MKFIRYLICGLLAGGFLLAATAGNTSAQTDLFTGGPAGASARSDWSQRVLRRERPAGSPVRTAAIPPWERQFRLVADEEPVPDDAYDADGLGADVTDSPEMVPPGMDSPYPTYNDWGDPSGQCDSCCEDYGQCGGGCGGGWAGYGPGYGGHGGHGMMRPGWHRGWWMRDLSLFAGVHGFKGPLDQGENGNFGFQEGANIGVPLGIAAVGFQAGVVAVQSNFEGDNVEGGHRDDHDQVFFTAGLFRRALCGGLQWGVVFDLMHDSYYQDGSTDLKQLRTEVGYVMAGGRREIGYFGAYGLDKEQIFEGQRSSGWLDPTDMFAVYYRRYFEGGGDGRFWAGFTGRGDGLLGADLRVPLGKNWAVENRVNYLIPKEGRNEGGQKQESWGLTVQLVYYFGQPARCVRNSPFRPMMNVADNSLFMVDRLQ